MKRTKVIFPSKRGLNSGPTLRDEYISFTETAACMVNLFALICTLLYTDIYLCTYKHKE